VQLPDALDGVHRQGRSFPSRMSGARGREGARIVDSTGQGLRGCGAARIRSNVLVVAACVDRSFEGHMHNSKTCCSIVLYGAHCGLQNREQSRRDGEGQVGSSILHQWVPTARPDNISCTAGSCARHEA